MDVADWVVEKPLLLVAAARFGLRQSVGVEYDVAGRVAFHELVRIDVAELATLDGADLDGHVRVAGKVDAVHAIGQLIDFADVVSEVQIEVEGEVLCLDGRRVEGELDALIADLAGVYPLLAPWRRSVDQHRLVLRRVVIVCEVEAETILQELHVEAHLIGGLDLGLQVVVHLDGLHGGLADAIREAVQLGVIEVVGLRVFSDLGPREAELREGNPPRQRLVDGAHEIREDVAQRSRRVEERAVAGGQGGRPVVPCGEVEREILPEGDLRGGKDGVHRPVAADVRRAVEALGGIEEPRVLDEHVLH